MLCIEDTPDCLLGVVIFAALVFMSRYWYIHMDEEDIEKTTFACLEELVQCSSQPLTSS